MQATVTWLYWRGLGLCSQSPNCLICFILGKDNKAHLQSVLIELIHQACSGLPLPQEAS